MVKEQGYTVMTRERKIRDVFQADYPTKLNEVLGLSPATVKAEQKPLA